MTFSLSLNIQLPAVVFFLNHIIGFINKPGYASNNSTNNSFEFYQFLP